MRRRLYVILLLVTAVTLCGCRRTLFPKNEQRTQFEAYNTMRYGHQITEQPDPFGLPEPALRARLGQKE
jgi:hypothetical protein